MDQSGEESCLYSEILCREFHCKCEIPCPESSHVCLCNPRCQATTWSPEWPVRYYTFGSEISQEFYEILLKLYKTLC